MFGINATQAEFLRIIGVLAILVVVTIISVVAVDLDHKHKLKKIHRQKMLEDQQFFDQIEEFHRDFDDVS